MTSRRIAFLLVALVAVVAAGCGGEGDEVPRDAVAVIDGSPIPKSEYDALLTQAKATYEAQERDFPKAGTPEYASLKNQAIQYLVQLKQFELKAKELEVTVTDKEVADRLVEIKKQYFEGDDEKYRDQLAEQGLTDAQVRRDLRAQLIQERIFEKVTGDVEVTDAEVEKYYEDNKDQYGTPESRDVRHILVPTKKQADQLYEQLKGGADFAALAKKFSKDPGSAAQGGKLTISRGQTVPAFDETAFLLNEGVLSRPVKTEFGFHLIEPVSDVKPAKTTPLAEVEESIRQQLLQTKRNDRMTQWVEETKEEFADETTYQVGFEPPPAVTETTGSGTETSE